MATTRLNPSFRFPTSRSVDSQSFLGLRATTASISYARTVTAPRSCLVARANEGLASVTISAATVTEKGEKRFRGESKGFVEEMRLVAMRLHTKDQAKEGEKESKSPEEGPIAKWDPTVDGYLRFLVDSKLVYDTLERIIDESNFPAYAGFKNTGLERAGSTVSGVQRFRTDFGINNKS